VSISGTVTVKGDKYRPQGDFHRIEPNTPIRSADEDWKLLGVTNPREMVYIHSYGGEAPFFESLARGRLMATRCDSPGCAMKGTIYQPFRIHCSDCLGRNTVFDMTELAQKTARIHTFMVCERSGAFNVLPTPIKFINIEFDGVPTILMSYLAVGEPAIGMRVIPIFRKVDPTYTITDLSWVPGGTRAADLPQGFAF
jgi:uncharacterized OB-fold protein